LTSRGDYKTPIQQCPTKLQITPVISRDKSSGGNNLQQG
jgi:hypothetical protein